MKKTKLLSLLLCLSLVCTLFVSGTTAYAEGGQPGDGMVVNKTATVNDNGTTTITLEAFATGSKVTTTETKDVPTDIILVIDQSGSMTENIGTVSYKAYTGNDTRNKNNYANRHNGGDGNLWHELTDGSYVSVSVRKTTTYTKLGNLVNYETSWGSLTSNCYYYYANNLYEKVGDEYKQVTVTRKSSGGWNPTYTYTYTFSDGTSVESEGNDTKPDLGAHASLYTPAADGNSTVYTYTYTGSTGAVQTIGTSTGADTQFTPAFYERTVNKNGGGSRLDAIKSAVTTFANNVATKAKGADGILGNEDDVNHRIAVVGFACGEWYQYTNYNYRNTEVFVGGNQYTYGTAAQGQYGNAFQSMDTSTGISNISNSIGALAADGGTLTNLGLEMANGIFGANPVPQGTQRNRVVVLFTDGTPGWSGYDSDVANKAIAQAATAKNTYGATVYSVGIFSGADATSAGNSSGNDTQKANWFMQSVSSNNGTPRTPSYYLSAGDSASLNNIFQQISNNIETGGSGTTLGSETVVKDIISPYFTLPEGTTPDKIRLDTYACTGKNGDEYTWSSNSDGASGASATVDGNKVSVTGFNFSENWCGTETDANGQITVRGKKLVISFDVKPKPGFLGGNGVPTNTSAGIYENADAQEPVKVFPIPTVNVPIKDVTVTAEDKNVYLLGKVTENDCKTNATAMCNGVDLLNESEYIGENAWKADYVKITTTVTNPTTALTEDGKYTISVKVEPKPLNPGIVTPTGTPAVAKTGTVEKNINVFKPELTFKDSEAYYGDSVPAKLESNRTMTEWKHGTTTDKSVTMIGTAPNLDITCTPDASKIDANGKINTTEDIGVAVTVMIGSTDVTKPHTTFQHKPCADKTCTVPNDYQFLIHVKTCTLTIKKDVKDTTIDDGQSFIFKVTGPMGTKTVVIQGNGSVTLTGLKVGEYKVIEDTAWSWRYTTTNGTQPANLSAIKDNVEVIVTNTLENDQWVSTDVYCKNEFKEGGKQTIINGSGTTVNGKPATN